MLTFSLDDIQHHAPHSVYMAACIGWQDLRLTSGI
jgi:hypothetical protein